MDGLKWVDSVLAAPKSRRKKLSDSILNGLNFFKARWSTHKNPKDKVLLSKNKEAEKLANWLKSSDFQVVGFSPNIMYVKEDGPKSDLDVLWNHEFAIPALLLKHKDLPFLILTNPALRFNDSIIKEIDANQYKAVIYGITG